MWLNWSAAASAPAPGFALERDSVEPGTRLGEVRKERDRAVQRLAVKVWRSDFPSTGRAGVWDGPSIMKLIGGAEGVRQCRRGRVGPAAAALSLAP